MYTLRRSDKVINEVEVNSNIFLGATSSFIIIILSPIQVTDPIFCYDENDCTYMVTNIVDIPKKFSRIIYHLNISTNFKLLLKYSK